MENVFLEAMDYLENKDPNMWEFFTSTALTELAIPETSSGIKKYVISLYKPLIYSEQRMSLISFRLIRNFPNKFDQELLNPFLSYYDIEKECLQDFKKVLYSSKNLSCKDLPKYSSCLVFINAIGFIHSENQQRLTRAIEINNTRNCGFNVYINDDLIQPVNTGLVKKIGTAFKSEITKK